MSRKPAYSPHDLLRKFLVAGTTIAALGSVAACGELPANSPAATASPNPGDKTPDTTASPTNNAEFDAFHDALVTRNEDGSIASVKTLQEVFPLPEQLTATELDADPESIPEVFPIPAGEAKTPQDAVRAWFVRENAAINIGSGDSSMVKGADGSDTLKADSKRDYLAAWRAMNGYGPESRPPQALLDNQLAAATAFTGTAVARGLDHPAFMPLVAKIPNIADMKVKVNADGTFDADVEVRGVFFADTKNIQLVDPSITFKETDVVETIHFTGCGIDEKTDTFRCKVVE